MFNRDIYYFGYFPIGLTLNSRMFCGLVSSVIVKLLSCVLIIQIGGSFAKILLNVHSTTSVHWRRHGVIKQEFSWKYSPLKNILSCNVDVCLQNQTGECAAHLVYAAKGNGTAIQVPCSSKVCLERLLFNNIKSTN